MLTINTNVFAINYPRNEHGNRCAATRENVEEILAAAYSRDAKRLNHCQAWTFPVVCNDRTYIVLRSYATNVALYSPRTGTLYELDRYSATTSQHVWKFARDVEADRIVHLYRRSDRSIETTRDYSSDRKLTAQQWRDVIANDFAGYIEHV